MPDTNMIQPDMLLYNAQLVTLAGPHTPRSGEEMNELPIVPNGAVAISDGDIITVGYSDDVLHEYPDAAQKIDADGRVVLPGFVDPHTHLVFGGSREHEMARKAAGESYLDILKSGGGINSTVRSTRKASEEELFQKGLHWLNLAAAHGTTTIEIKSGYGLEPNAEEKILRVINRLNDAHVLDIIPTFLGAHIVPGDWHRGEYINWIIEEALPQFKDMARFCDVFCESEAYTVDETIQILSAASEVGYGLKAHVGQFHALGAAGEAAQLGAISVEHVDILDERELALMKEHGTIAVLLPGASFFTGAAFADPKKFMERGIPIALATDFNPGSSPCISMQMIIAFACIETNMTAAQAISAATINAAHSINMADRIGSLEIGKYADIILLNIDSPEQLPYYFGANLIDKVIKKGRIIYE